MRFASLSRKSSLRRAMAGEDGLTLLEVALALVILSIVSMYFLSFFTNSASQSKLTNQRLSATHLANAKLHEVQSLEFTELQTKANCSPGGLPDTTNGIYLIRTEVCRISDKYPANPDILYITVTTFWLPDPAAGAGNYRHKVSIVGAVKKDYAAAPPASGGNGS
ncbi:type IV pilus modification PilV family protein [Paenibacillus macerans]|uniref:type IV pilus modification PilV family protein n=1 Tax=Paenibacillus macerans TaxID=44252 RepID=UPI003D31BDB7